MSQQLQKCTIINLDEPSNKIPAQYNPKKVSAGKSVGWDRHPSSGGRADMLEFGSAKNRTLSLELFFDGMENQPYAQNLEHATKFPSRLAPPINVETTYVQPLLGLTVPDKKREGGKDGEKAKRPPFVMVAWGCMRPFRGVIESLNYEYTMFMPNGMPVRATVTLKLTEIDIVQMTSKHTSEYDNAMETAKKADEDYKKP